MPLDISTEIKIGIIWVICPVISKTITLIEMVWVTAPVKEAAPTVAYPPATIWCLKKIKE